MVLPKGGRVGHRQFFLNPLIITIKGVFCFKDLLLLISSGGVKCKLRLSSFYLNCVGTSQCHRASGLLARNSREMVINLNTML